MSDWTIGAVLDAIAEVAPDRPMTIGADRQSTFAETADRTRRLANFLTGRGFGVYGERETLERWECGQDRVALIMHNDLYLDAVIGCLKARTVPVNVNYYCTPREVSELLDYIKPRAVLYHRSLGAKFADVLPPAGAELLIAIDDGSDAPLLAGAITLDEVLAAGDVEQDISPSPNDLLMICTGGATGRPKGVMWRQGDVYVSLMNGADHVTVSEIHDKVRHAGPPCFVVSPLIHAAGIWTAFSAVLSGQTTVLYETKVKFDPRTVLETAERHKVGLMTMVGDAYAAPLLEELGRRPYKLSSLFAIGFGEAVTDPKYQAALLEYLPQVTIINGYGPSAKMGVGRSQRGDHQDTFELWAGGRVLSEDYTRLLEPGEAEINWIAHNGRIPLGYFSDPEATLGTFPEVQGQRVVVCGDRASIEVDGTLRLLRRDSLAVNSAGETVFVEEVEELLRAHPEVADALVVGKPSERWGEKVVALIVLHDGAELAHDLLHKRCAALARFGAPNEFIVVEHIRRLGNGKADYRWAASRAAKQSPLAT